MADFVLPGTIFATGDPVGAIGRRGALDNLIQASASMPGFVSVQTNFAGLISDPAIFFGGVYPSIRGQVDTVSTVEGAMRGSTPLIEIDADNYVPPLRPYRERTEFSTSDRWGTNNATLSADKQTVSISGSSNMGLYSPRRWPRDGYVEVRVISETNLTVGPTALKNLTTWPGQNTTSMMYHFNGYEYYNGGTQGLYETYGPGDVLGFLRVRNTHTFRVYKNGVFQFQRDILGVTTLHEPWYFAIGNSTTSLVSARVNFGQSTFIHPPQDADWVAYDLSQSSRVRRSAEMTLGVAAAGYLAKPNTIDAHEIVPISDNPDAITVATSVDQNLIDLTWEFDGYPAAHPLFLVNGDELITPDASGVTGDVEPPYIFRTPGFILFNGNNYLTRPFPEPGDDALDLPTAFTVSVMVDPALVLEETDGVIFGRHSQSDRGWHIDHVASTRFVRMYVSEDFAGTNFVERATSVPIARRSLVTFVYDTGTLDVYVDGVLQNGVLNTGGTPVGVPYNPPTESGTAGAIDVTDGPFEFWRGALYTITIWHTALSALDVAKQGLRGFIEDPDLEDPGLDLRVNWSTFGIISEPQQPFLASWVDDVAQLSWTNTSAPFVPTTQPTYCFANSPLAPSLIQNRWDITMNDVAYFDLAPQSLATSYTFDPPFRAWAALADPPNLSSGFQDEPHDFTLVVYARKVVGTVTATILRMWDFAMYYDRVADELYIIKGTDTSNTLQNTRHSFGFGLFNVEGVTSRFYLMYDAARDEFTARFGFQREVPTITATNEANDVTGVTFADEMDFIEAIRIPAAISDAHADRLERDFNTRVSIASTETQSYTELEYQRVEVDSEPENTFPNGTDQGVEFPTQVIASEALDGVSYFDSPYPVQELLLDEDTGPVFPPFIDPNPSIVTVTADLAKFVTAIVVAGPTDAGQLRTYWEIELVSGSDEVVIHADTLVPSFFSLNREQTDTFQIPAGQDWQDKRIRFVIESFLDPAQSWRTEFVRMEGDNFNNNPPQVIIQPAPGQAPDQGDIDLDVQLETRDLVIEEAEDEQILTIDVDPDSRYKLTRVYDDGEGDGPNYALLEPIPDFFTADQDRYNEEYRLHRVQRHEVGFLDILARQYFGENQEHLWWVIAYQNGIIDPELEMFPGQSLIIPPRQALTDFQARASAG